MARTIAKDHDEKRAQILKGAARVFAEEGYDRASMTGIAQVCGISKANIYHYYDGKEALLFDLLETYLRELRDRVCGLPLDGMAPEDKLFVVVREVLMAYCGADDEHRVQVSGTGQLPVERQQVLRGYQRELVDLMKAILKEAAPESFAARPADLHPAAMSVYGMLNWHFMWNRKQGAHARETYARLVTDMTLRGLRGL